jgi:hypothetical protein
VPAGIGHLAVEVLAGQPGCLGGLVLSHCAELAGA